MSTTALMLLLSIAPALAQDASDSGLHVDDLPAVQEPRPDVMPRFNLREPVGPEREVGIVGSLSRPEVDAALRPHRAALDACGEATELRFEVATDGTVAAASVLPQSALSGTCLVAEALTVKFPALDGGVAVVRLPLH